jgi:hypothetical protein
MELPKILIFIMSFGIGWVCGTSIFYPPKETKIIHIPIGCITLILWLIYSWKS